jgi:hypothetical protein
MDKKIEELKKVGWEFSGDYDEASMKMEGWLGGSIVFLRQTEDTMDTFILRLAQYTILLNIMKLQIALKGLK